MLHLEKDIIRVDNEALLLHLEKNMTFRVVFIWLQIWNRDP